MASRCERPSPRLHRAVGVAAVRARGGVNTGGGNGVFYVEVLEDVDEHFVRIRNLVPKKSSAPTVEAVVERAFVRPLLRGRDIAAWAANPQDSIVFPYGGSDIRNPLAESQLRSAAPRTYAYLSRFRSLLASRKELARWGGRWYPLFRIGPYRRAAGGLSGPTAVHRRFGARFSLRPTQRFPIKGSSRSIRRRTGCVTRLCVSQQRQRPQVCRYVECDRRVAKPADAPPVAGVRQLESVPD